VGDDRRGGQLGGRRRGAARRCPRPVELGGVGVETEADLAAALVYERRQPIRELRQEISRP
jgi:hypothetical protein